MFPNNSFQIWRYCQQTAEILRFCNYLKFQKEFQQKIEIRKQLKLWALILLHIFCWENVSRMRKSTLSWSGNSVVCQLDVLGNNGPESTGKEVLDGSGHVFTWKFSLRFSTKSWFLEQTENSPSVSFVNSR